MSVRPGVSRRVSAGVGASRCVSACPYIPGCPSGCPDVLPRASEHPPVLRRAPARSLSFGIPQCIRASPFALEISRRVPYPSTYPGVFGRALPPPRYLGVFGHVRPPLGCPGVSRWVSACPYIPGSPSGCPDVLPRASEHPPVLRRAPARPLSFDIPRCARASPFALEVSRRVPYPSAYPGAFGRALPPPGVPTGFSVPRCVPLRLWGVPTGLACLFLLMCPGGCPNVPRNVSLSFGVLPLPMRVIPCPGAPPVRALLPPRYPSVLGHARPPLRCPGASPAWSLCL